MLEVCVVELPEISPPTKFGTTGHASSRFVRIMDPPGAQCVATKTVSLFTLLLLLSTPTNAQDPGELSIKHSAC